jgi:hypothetical protein
MDGQRRKRCTRFKNQAQTIPVRERPHRRENLYGETNVQIHRSQGMRV